MSTITSGDGDDISISVSSNGALVVVEVSEAGGHFRASIWLRPEQVDDLIHALATARVEISKAKPKS